MINIETIEVSGFEGAIKGMRNPFKNREKSDSAVYDADKDGNPIFTIGSKDLELCQKLLRAGGDDDAKFMRYIHVQADVNAPLYWWKEFDTYKVATVANSESTMHTITKREFTLDDFSYDQLITFEDDDDDDLMEPAVFYHMINDRIKDKDIDLPDNQLELLYPHDILTGTIHMLNEVREAFLDAKKNDEKALAYRYWYNLIQLLPSSYMQKRTVDLNYQTLRRIFFARRHHKLTEWSGENGFCGWIKSLPYAEELITYEPCKNKGITKC